MPSGLRTPRHGLRQHEPYILKLVHRWRYNKMDEPGTPRSGAVRPQGYSANEEIGLLRVGDGDI